MYIDIHILKETYRELAETVAIATVKQLDPSFDEVKYKDAVRIAGSARWLNLRVKKGQLNRIRRGTAKNSPVYYSRLEIAALKHAEATAKTYFVEHRKRKKHEESV